MKIENILTPIIVAVFGIIIAFGIQSINKDNNDPANRIILAINTTDKELLIGIEYETGNTTVKVSAHDLKGFKTRAGKGRVIVLNNDGSVFRKGNTWTDIQPQAKANGRNIIIDADGAENIAIVDVRFLYKNAGLIQVENENGFKPDSYLMALVPASEIMIYDQPYYGVYVYPWQKLPEQLNKSRDRCYLALRRVDKRFTNTNDVIKEVVRQLYSK